jgi:hypothetical protein
MTQTIEKVAPTAMDTTQNARLPFACVTAMLARLEELRHPAVLFCILTGYGFAGAENWLPAFIAVFLGLALAKGPESFYKWLHRVREAQDAALAGHEPDGSYYGDGVPRDASGSEYEPLSWPEGLRRI